MHRDVLLARHAALTGARLALRYFGSVEELARECKSDGSLVTEADRAVEAAIREILMEERPADAMLGEESGQHGRGRRRWIIDPIDGTVAFASGDNRWVVLLALELDGRVVTAVAVAPASGAVWWAQRAEGALQADLVDGFPVRQRTISCAALKEQSAVAKLGVIPSTAVLPAAGQRLVAGMSDWVEPCGWAVHPALLVASGELDLAVQAGGQIWDYAATSLIVEEAGGRFSGFDGRGHPHSGPGLYSSGDPLHTLALRYVTPGAAGLAGDVSVRPHPTAS